MEGDGHRLMKFTIEVTMVRNAGGRGSDAIRTLAVSQTIEAPGMIVVTHHTGMLLLFFLYPNPIQLAIFIYTYIDRSDSELMIIGEM